MFKAMNDKLFKALVDPTRRRLVRLLATREHCVCEFQQLLRAPQPTVSRHLAVLRHAGLVEDHRAGQRVFYALDRRLGRAACRFIEKVEAPDKKE